MIDRQHLQKVSNLLMMFEQCSQLENKISSGSIGKSSQVPQRSSHCRFDSPQAYKKNTKQPNLAMCHVKCFVFQQLV